MIAVPKNSMQHVIKIFISETRNTFKVGRIPIIRLLVDGLYGELISKSIEPTDLSAYNTKIPQRFGNQLIFGIIASSSE